MSDEKEPATDGESGDRQELPSWDRTKARRKANVKVEAETDAFTRGVVGAAGAAKKQGVALIAAGAVLVGLIGAGVYIYKNQSGANVEATTHTLQGLIGGSRQR